MAWTVLKAAVDSALPTNNANQITASDHRTILKEAIDKLGLLQYKGIATPTTIPGSYDGERMFFAIEAGTYTNFLDSGSTALVVSSGVLAVLKSDGTSWSKDEYAIGFGSTSQPFFKSFVNVTGDSIDMSTWNDLPDPSTYTEDSINASIELSLGGTNMFFKNVAKSSLTRYQWRINYASQTIEFSSNLKGKDVYVRGQNFFVNI